LGRGERAKRISESDWPLGAVELKVLDLDREATFYDWFGFTEITRDKEHAVLGADGRPLVRLSLLPGGNERPRHSAGLYHFAILLPTEEDLGGFLTRTLQERLPLTGTADHFVSQALYFDDPEGNGIEVYADRPRKEWQYPNGELNIGTAHLDFERLLRIAARPKNKLPDPTLLGHMHLNVADLDVSQAYYEGLGMELQAKAGHVMRFLSWDGYHHHLGINVLEGRGAAPVTPDARGLRAFEVRRLANAQADPDGVQLTPSL
jgi:catechol 2,3-dioxygenase